MNATRAALETGVLAQLRSIAPATDIAVEPYPPKPADYTLLHPRGALLLFISGSSSGQSRQQIPGVRQRATRFVVTILLRDFSSHQDAYGWLDKIEAALFGFIPADGWRAIIAVSDNFVSEVDGIWQYDMVFESQAQIVSAFDLCQPST